MPKTSVDDWSTTASNNQDVNNISILGSAVNSNVDNAMREIMKQVADFRDDMPARYFVDDVVSRSIGATVKRIRVQYVDPDDATGAGEMEIARMSKADIDADTIPTEAYWRSVDRFMPNGSTDNTNGGYWVNDTPVMKVNQFGTGFDAAQLALTHHALMGRKLDFGKGLTYSGTQLTIPSDADLIGDAEFVFDGDLTGTDITVTIGDDFKAERFRVNTPGGGVVDQNEGVISIGDNFDIGYLEITADAPRVNRGVGTAPNGKIGYFKSIDVDRPLFCDYLAVGGGNVEIGFLDIDGYVRGFRVDSTSATIYGGYIRRRSVNADKDPGHNGLLLTESPLVRLPNGITVEDAGEHAIRNSGSSLVSGVLYLKGSGGCGYKSNSGTVRSPHTRIAGIFGTNIGQTSGNNSEMLRLTRTDDCWIGFVHSEVEDGFLAPRRAVQANNCTGLRIGPISGEYNNNIVILDGNSDSDNEGDAGPVEDFHIIIGKATCAGTAAVAFSATTINGADPVMTIGDGIFEFAGASGWSDYIHTFTYDGEGSSDPIVVTAPIEFRGFIKGDIQPYANTANADPSHSLVTYNLQWEDKVKIGQASAFRIGANGALAMQEWVVPSDSVFAGGGDVVSRGVVINGSAQTAGAGNYSAAIEWSRLATLRRAAAIAMIQEGSNAQNTSLDFLVGQGTAATDALVRVLRLSYRGGGVMSAPTMPTYADNAAAVSGGLAVNDLYKTAAGDVRIVV
jgi:hypothetical protein